MHARSLVAVFVAISLLVWFAPVSFAADAGAGAIQQLTGDVTITGADNVTRKAVAKENIRSGDTVTLDGKADLKTVPTQGADVQVSIAFPARVGTTNGTRDGDSRVSWTLPAGEVSTMRAEVNYADPSTRSFAGWAGIMAGLALGWVAEPALSGLLEPVVRLFPPLQHEEVSRGLSAVLAFAALSSSCIFLRAAAASWLAFCDSARTWDSVDSISSAFMYCTTANAATSTRTTSIPWMPQRSACSRVTFAFMTIFPFVDG